MLRAAGGGTLSREIYSGYGQGSLIASGPARICCSCSGLPRTLGWRIGAGSSALLCRAVLCGPSSGDAHTFAGSVVVHGRVAQSGWDV